MSVARMLVIEDEFLIQMLWESVAELANAEVIDTIVDVESALDRITRKDFDCVILDVKLRGVESLSVANRLYELGIPTIVCTGYKIDDLNASFFRFPIVSKPFQIDETADFLKKVVSSYVSA